MMKCLRLYPIDFVYWNIAYFLTCKIFQEIAKIAPARRAYPEHLKLYGITKWKETLVPQAAYDGLKMRVQQLLTFHKELVFLHHPNTPESKTTKDPFFFLTKQAYFHDLFKYSSVGQISDCQIEPHNKVVITKTPFVEEAANECSRIAWMGHYTCKRGATADFSPHKYALQCQVLTGSSNIGSSIREWNHALYLKFFNLFSSIFDV